MRTFTFSFEFCGITPNKKICEIFIDKLYIFYFFLSIAGSGRGLWGKFCFFNEILTVFSGLLGKMG